VEDRCKAPLILTLSCQHHAPAALPPWKSPGVNWIRGW